MKSLQEFKAKTMTAEQDAKKINMVLERLEQQDSVLTEYDVVVRQVVEEITVVDKFQI